MSSRTARQRAWWIAWLQVVLVLLIGYALVLVFGGSLAEKMFSALGFGPPADVTSAEISAYLRLPYAVLGAVLAGWAVLMLVVVRGPLSEGSPWALTALAAALAVWFVLDTGMSFVLDYPMHALFNVPFALALGLPLWRLRVEPMPQGPEAASRA